MFAPQDLVLFSSTKVNSKYTELAQDTPLLLIFNFGAKKCVLHTRLYGDSVYVRASVCVCVSESPPQSGRP